MDDIFVVTGFQAELLSDFLRDEGVRAVYNEKFEEGMFSSIQAGVRAAYENGNDCFLMTPVDVPLIPPYIIKALLNRGTIRRRALYRTRATKEKRGILS